MPSASAELRRQRFLAATGRQAWPLLLERIAKSFGSSGAVLTPIDKIEPGSFYSPSMAGYVKRYFSENWHKTDPRRRYMPLMIKNKVISNADFFTEREMENDEFWTQFFFTENLKWTLNIHFSVGEEDWTLALHRSAEEGIFSEAERRRALAFRDELADAAAVARRMASVYVDGLLNALQSLGRPALVLDKNAKLVALNAEMQETLWANKRLVVKNDEVSFADDALNKAIRNVIRPGAPHDGPFVETHPMATEDWSNRDHSVEIFALDGAAHNIFDRARALVVLSKHKGKEQIDPPRLMKLFNLTPAEAMLLQKFYTSQDLGEAARQLGIAKETARTHLRSIFAKTRTRKQSELVLLLSLLGPQPKVIKSYLVDQM